MAELEILGAGDGHFRFQAVGFAAMQSRSGARFGARASRIGRARLAIGGDGLHQARWGR